MNPLEIMAKAFVNARALPDENLWDEFTGAGRVTCRAGMRAALLALAEIPDCDFPQAAAAAGRIADEECSTIGGGLMAAFRATLRMLAEAPTT